MATMRRIILSTFTSPVVAAVCLTAASVMVMRSVTTPMPIGRVIDAQIALESDPNFSREQRGHPADFSAEELRLLEQRFGIHGPQTPIAQLFTRSVDQLEPLRALTLTHLAQLKPVILRESAAHRLNPMLLTGILYDEIQHSKPGESLPFVAHSGLVSTHGPAQLGISELIHQGRLPANPSDLEIAEARNILLDPEQNVALLAGKLARLKKALDLPNNRHLSASNSFADAKAIATLAYLHNGKLDYPRRILRYMQDPALHGLIYSTFVPQKSMAI